MTALVNRVADMGWACITICIMGSVVLGLCVVVLWLLDRRGGI